MSRDMGRFEIRLLTLLLVGITLLMFTSIVTAQEQPGFYEVTSVPSGADVLVNGVFQGETPVLVPVFSTAMNGTTIRLLMQGFQPWEQEYSVPPVQGAIVQVKVTLIPISPSGILKVSSSPSGAMVTIDNGKAQMTPWTYRDLPTGTHLVSCYLSGFEPYVKNVQIMPGESIDLHANMTVRTSSGSLTVSSEPGGATIYLDGVYSGITNTVIGNIPLGTHQVRVIRAGYEDYEEWVIIKPNQQVPLTVQLTQIASPLNGSLTVTSEPPGASVFMDGTFVGTTETGRALELTRVSPGSHQIYLSMRNYEDLGQTVDVRAGEITSVAARLNPSPMPQECGQLIITSEPAGAEIYVDGSFRATTPAAIDTVCSGTHGYTLKLPGYQDYSSTVQVTPGQVLQVNTIMKSVSEPGAEPTQSPGPGPVFILLLISLVAFVMAKRK